MARPPDFFIDILGLRRAEIARLTPSIFSRFPGPPWPSAAMGQHPDRPTTEPSFSLRGGNYETRLLHKCPLRGRKEGIVLSLPGV
jgi:hypothetical protein